MRHQTVVMLLVVVLALAATSYAEKPNLSPDALRAKASHVVRGKVVAVYTRVRRQGLMEVTRYVAEVKVEAVEKGEGLDEGQLIYIRYWQQEWKGSIEDMPAGTTGHRGIPDEGQTLRIYLARHTNDGFGNDVDDGGLNVIGANGFESLD